MTTTALTDTAAAPAAAARFNQSGLFFLPRTWQRPIVVRWLKKVHAWTGFWGAALFFLMGLSGFFLNHRDQAKIDTGRPVEVSQVDVAVAPDAIGSEAALGRWAQTTLGITAEPRKPREKGGGGGEGRGGRDADVRASFNGRDVPVAPRWVQAFNHPDGTVTVDYVPGSTSVSVKKEAQNLLGFLKNLHKGSGLGIGWILFLDSIAGALIAMSLTGFLLWSRLHGTRLLAGGIVIASTGLAIAAVARSLM